MLHPTFVPPTYLLHTMTRRKHAKVAARAAASSSASGSSSSHTQKFYGIANGHNNFCGVVRSWPECAARVKGAPNAKFKRFPTYKAAQLFSQGKIGWGAQKKKKKVKFYGVLGGSGGFDGVVNTWDEVQMYVNGVKGARHKSFNQLESANQWVMCKGVEGPIVEEVMLTNEPAKKIEATYETRDDQSSKMVKGVEEVKADEGIIPSSHQTSVNAKSEDAEKSQQYGKFHRDGPFEVEMVELDENGKVVISDKKQKLEFFETPKAPLSVIEELRKRRQQNLIVYTDGACTKNGKIGARAGYGVYFADDHPLNISRPLPGAATNQRAEMTAALEAIRTVLANELLQKGGVLELRTDSNYTKRGLEDWMYKWVRSGWVTASGSAVKNKDLWLQLMEAKEQLMNAGIVLHLVWVRGHSGDPGNEAADRLAVAGIYANT